jgi:hypothetical protein
MANLIQIKRSETTAIPTSLEDGELAYTSNGEVLFIGSNGVVIPIGGQRVPGVLTANQALVVNSSSSIDSIKVANLVPTKIYANGSHGSVGQVLVSDGANVFWGTGTAGTNTTIQFNDSGTANGIAAFTFNKDTNTMFVSGAITVGSNVITNTSTISIGNSTVNTTANSSELRVNGTIVNSSIVQVAGQFRGYTANVSTSIEVGSNVFVNTSTISVGNSTVNTQITGSRILVGGADDSSNVTSGAVVIDGGLGVGKRINTKELAVGNTTVYSSANGTTIVTQDVLATGTVNATVLSVGGSVVGNNSGIFTSGVVNGDIVQVGSNFRANTTQTSVGTFLTVAGNAVVNGQLTVNNTAALGNTTITGFANVSTSLNVTGAATVNGALTVNNTAAVGNTTITGSLGTTGAATVNGAFTVNNTASVGNTTITGSANVTGHLQANSLSVGDTTISGNLTVTGTLTTVSANNISITDSMIQLASNNTTTDVLDIGLFGSYEAGDSGNHEHTGFFRDASDSGVWKLFEGLEVSPTTTVDTGNNTFEFATLQTFLKTGGAGLTGLIANSTTIALTANSTLNVAIVANTLTLSTALAGNSGGTGLASYTAEDILVANSTNGFRKLALGTAGHVLQSNGTALIYSTLDGGSF